ncbi:methyltransferase [Candidatus Woesearchaeota archaeon]|nr:methyltransferase [Candidatus Woesearchaeota archaeon]
MNLKSLLKEKLTDFQLKNLKTAFDIVGDIAIIEIPGELEPVEQIIAVNVMRLNKSVKTVVKKVGAHEGEFRLQKYKFLVGEEKYITIHKESAVKLKVDLNKTYFSVRLSSERLRIAKMIKPGESILVVGAGCGPYPLVFSKNSKTMKIVAIEKNVDSCHMFRENILLNKVKNIEVICCDFSEFQSEEKFDRVVLALPYISHEILGKIVKFCKIGTICHFYGFYHEDEFSKVKDLIISSFGVVSFLDLVKCGQKKPRIWRICQDYALIQ